jgi:hypothetical protein
MLGKKIIAAAVALLVAIALFAGTASAAFDPAGIYGTWSGTSTFDNGDGLSGHVDWIVYGPDGFPYTGYLETPGELTYAYQVFNEGTHAISEFIIPTPNPLDNIDSFSEGGIAGYAPVEPPVAPDWYFSDTPGSAIPTGGASEGLVYSSPNVPETYYYIVINGGTVAIGDGIPAPSSTSIPEPATWCSLLLAFGVLGMWRLVRK